MTPLSLKACSRTTASMRGLFLLAIAMGPFTVELMAMEPLMLFPLARVHERAAKALTDGTLYQIKVLLDEEPGFIHEPDKGGNTFLHTLVTHYQANCLTDRWTKRSIEDLFKQVLSKNGDPNAIGSTGETVFVRVAYDPRCTVLKALIDTFYRPRVESSFSFVEPAQEERVYAHVDELITYNGNQHLSCVALRECSTFPHENGLKPYHEEVDQSLTTSSSLLYGFSEEGDEEITAESTAQEPSWLPRLRAYKTPLIAVGGIITFFLYRTLKRRGKLLRGDTTSKDATVERKSGTENAAVAGEQADTTNRHVTDRIGEELNSSENDLLEVRECKSLL